jgi:hypothetical protein
MNLINNYLINIIVKFTSYNGVLPILMFYFNFIKHRINEKYISNKKILNFFLFKIYKYIF